MSYDEEEHKRSRVVVETPTARREVVQQQTLRYPQERRSFSTGSVVAVALTAIAVTAIVFLFLMNSGDNTTEANVNLRAATQPTPFAQAPVIVQTPMTAPTPIIIQPPPTTTAPAPVIIQAPPPATTTAPPASSAPPPATSANDDTVVQQKLDKAFADDAEISAANIDATVVSGKALLTGTVNSEALKQRAERVAYSIKGVHSVDNKIIVSP